MDICRKKKYLKNGSVENIYNNNVLGGVCRSRREGQTGEDVRQDIFELSPANVAKSKIVY
jgi:hypothetical protein